MEQPAANALRPRRRLRRAAAVALAAAVIAPASPGSTAPRACSPRSERVPAGTWSSLPVEGIAGSPGVWRMDAAEDGLVVVADYLGVLVSRDGGCRWTRRVRFDEIAPERALHAEDVEIVSGPRGGSVYVLAVSAVTGNWASLLSSRDGGRTWSARDLPPEIGAVPLESADLSSREGGPSPLYLFGLHRNGSAVLFSTRDGGATWEWSGLATTGAPAAACASPGPCTVPPLRAVAPDPSGPDRVWGLTAPSAGEGAGLAASSDAGSSWEHVQAPVLLGGPALLDVAPGRPRPVVLLLGDFGNFGLSRDEGVSWEVGRFPESVSGPHATQQSFDLGHTSDGRLFASILGRDRGTAWAGNVMLFDGTEWENVSPEAYAGYDREDEAGKPLRFSDLTGLGRGFVMLSSSGELFSFGPRR